MFEQNLNLFFDSKGTRHYPLPGVSSASKKSSSSLEEYEVSGTLDDVLLLLTLNPVVEKTMTIK